jgi:hypothetical protein
MIREIIVDSVLGARRKVDSIVLATPRTTASTLTAVVAVIDAPKLGGTTQVMSVVPMVSEEVHENSDSPADSLTE